MMMFTDTSRESAIAKDPAVVEFGGTYLLYYTIKPATGGLRIGIAKSVDLDSWTKIGELTPLSPCDANGLGAPGAIVLEDRIHLFYQTYGNGRNDAICHATSTDGVTFTPNASNPVLPNGAPGEWNSCESGHPFVLQAGDGTDHLFFQGSGDSGRSYYLSRKQITWQDGAPRLG